MVSHIAVKSFCFAASSEGSGGSLGSRNCSGLAGDKLGDFLFFFFLFFSSVFFAARFFPLGSSSSSCCSVLTLTFSLPLPSLKGLPGPRLRCGLWPLPPESKSSSKLSQSLSEASPRCQSAWRCVARCSHSRQERPPLAYNLQDKHRWLCLC